MARKLLVGGCRCSSLTGVFIYWNLLFENFWRTRSCGDQLLLAYRVNQVQHLVYRVTKALCVSKSTKVSEHWDGSTTAQTAGLLIVDPVAR
jgi:hypothetical protein